MSDRSRRLRSACRRHLLLSAVQTVAQLSALTRLRMASWSTRASHLPGCEELARLRGSSLQDLNVSLHQVLRGLFGPRSQLHARRQSGQRLAPYV